MLTRFFNLLFAIALVTPALASDSHDPFFERLAGAESDWMRAFAAPSLPAPAGKAILADLADEESISPHAAYRVSSACRAPDLAEICNENDLQQRFLQAEPENLAAYVLAMDGAEESKQIRLMNLAARNATYIDTYWMRDGLTMLEQTRGIPLGEDQRSEYSDMSVESAAALHLFSYYIAAIGPSYQELTQLCGFEQLLEPQRRKNCLRIGQVMQAKPNSLIDSWIGNLLERRVLLIENPDSVAALRKWREKQAMEIAFLCFQKSIQVPDNPDAIEQPVEYIDRISGHGEYEGNRLHAQAVHAEYPDRFETDPEECAKYPDLPDQKLLALLQHHGRLSQVYRFKQEQEQARAALEVSEETIK